MAKNRCGGHGHCGHHTHGNPVKEVSRVKKQTQKIYQRLETCHLEPLALLGAMVEKKNLPKAQDMLSQASCVLVGCYGDGYGHCVCHMRSPVKI